MVLDIKGIPKGIFKTSNLRNLGFGGEKEVPPGHEKETHYAYSLPSAAFTTANPDVDDVTFAGTELTNNGAGDLEIFAPVYLPDGVTIKKCVVWGTTGVPNNWSFVRIVIGTGDAGGFGTTINTEIDPADIPYDSAIDNYNYAYYFKIDGFAQNDTITGARIIYSYEDPVIFVEIPET